jgi:hypothetical protein
MDAAKSPEFSEWFGNFLTYTQFDEVDPVKISDIERSDLLNLPLPNPITGSDINKFIDRWNRTIDYWDSRLFNTGDIPVGQSRDFIALDQIGPLQDALEQAVSETNVEGYVDIIDAITEKSQELQKALDGSGGVCAKVKIQIDQEAVMTRAAFLGNLEIENGNPTNLTNLNRKRPQHTPK